MPRAPMTCPTCKRPRRPGGKSHADGLCRLCWHAARMALPDEARQRGPYRTAGHVATPKTSVIRPTATALPPLATESWWATAPRASWSATVAEQQPRMQAGTVTTAEPNRDAFEAAGTW